VPPTRVALIGAALDLGAGRRGVDMGPSAIRYAGLSDRLERAGIEVEDRGNVQAALAETRATGSERARFLDEILET
jgi:arginase